MIFRFVRRSGAPRDETAWAAMQEVSSLCGRQRTLSDAANRRHRCGTQRGTRTANARLNAVPARGCVLAKAER